MAAIAALAAHAARPAGRQPDDRCPCAAARRAGRRDVGSPAGRDRRVDRGDAGPELLLSSPGRNFTIADPENWVALFAFLIVAVIASQLSAAAQERAREAVSRRNEVTRLFDLSRDVLLTTETTGGLEALARHISRRFELARVAVCLPADHGLGDVPGRRGCRSWSTRATSKGRWPRREACWSSTPTRARTAGT